MKKLDPLIYIFIFLLLNACAKQGAPLGGPVDEKSPKVTSILPNQNSINSNPTEIIVTFDEYIKLENPSKNIIITPKINKDELEISALRNTLKIILNQNLEEQTTYVFNFQKAVLDLSEGNPADDLKLVFSTGNQIDSLTLTGKVNFYYPKEKENFQKVIIGLYLENDSTTGFKSAPYYLSQIDSSGNFQINNIKPGEYKSFAWEDENSNLKIDSKSERFDFFLDTLDITQSIDSLHFNLAIGDQTPIKIIRSTAVGRQYEIIFNRNVADLSTDNPFLGKSVFYTLSTDKRLKIYSKTTRKDSVSFNFIFRDSSLNSIDTTIYAKFIENDRKPEKLILSGNTGKSFYTTMPIELKFNKPIESIIYDSLYISYDTASKIQVTPSMLYFTDSMMRTNLNISVPIMDELPFDIFTIHASDSSFIDIEGSYNEKSFLGNYRKLKKETLSDAISGTITNGTDPFIIQLINNKSEIVAEQYLIGSNQYQFTLIEPATYQIRVIEDRNLNGRWDPNNFILQKYAERITYFEDKKTKSRDLIIRGGWTLQEQNIEFKKQTGLKVQ